VHKQASQWLIVPVAFMLVLLFLGGPLENSHPVFRQIWNSGHFFLFSGLIYLLCRLPRAKQRKPITLLFLVVAFSLGFGLLTEFIQLFIGRSFALSDIHKDLLGGLVGFCLAMISRLHTLPQNLGLIGFSVLFTFFGLSSLFVALYQEWRIYQSVPVLADFEQPGEKSRWQYSNVEFAIVPNHASNHLNALQVTFQPANYPTINLTHFYRDWRAFNALEFDAFNPSTTSVAMVVKIFDEQHVAHRFDFNDRFNREIILPPGNNTVSISLHEIQHSPATRVMDLGNIESLSFFMTNVKVPKTIYLDHIRLE